MFRKSILGTGVAIFTLSVGLVAAQGEPVATGLISPRHISFDSDGTLYIAEAGSGGDLDGTGPFGALKFGETSQISAVTADGEQAVVIPGLISMDAGGQIEGATDVYVTEDSIWATLGMSLTGDFPEGKVGAALVEFDKATGETKQVIDLAAFETENNPDQAEELVSNPAALAVDADGKVYVADASGNSLLTWTAEDGLQVFAVWPAAQDSAQSVPTSVDIGPEGDVYVGFLSGFPFAAGSARIEVYGADGVLKTTYSDLTLITDVLVAADGSLYAVQMADGFGDTGFNADSGSVIKVSAESLEVIAEGLSSPYGIAQSTDGTLYVSVNALGAPESGEVVTVGGM